jgi:integrase
MPHTAEEKYVPPETDVLKLIAAADPETDERDILLIILNTTARIDEVLRLKWHDINMEKKTITRWTRKRKSGSYESITCHMNNDLYSLMKRRWENRENEMWIFYNSKTSDRYQHRPKLMRGLCKRAQIEPAFGFHALRHFVATYLADTEKVSKKTIGGLLGHKALQTTEIYLHSISESEVQALESLSGKFTNFSSD